MTYSSVNAVRGTRFTQREVKFNATVNVAMTFTLPRGEGQVRETRGPVIRRLR
jgi:hypothetical protein